MEPDLSIIIVNMNSSSFLGPCLASIRETKGSLDVEVILIDNGSTDDSVEVTKREWPSVVLLEQGKNIGYVPANNVGLRVATGRIAMLLNNDTLVQEGCLQHIVEFADRTEDAGIISPAIFNPDGSDQGTARRFPTLANGLFGRRSILTRLFPRNRWTRRYMVGRHQAGDMPFEVEIISSACLVAPTSLLKQVGGMDEAFRLYWVDAELCSRIRSMGYKVYSIPRAKLIHFEGLGGSTKTFRQKCRSTIAFHRDAYLAYTKVHHLGPFHPGTWMVAAILTTRASLLMLLQLLRPWKPVSSGGRN
jgi:N-acetylglucosaminyl-diphospho-decaprenol L-rhamnosyltransferase